jgi:aldose 1-epimerase
MPNQITQRLYGITDEGQVVTEFTLTNSHGLVMKVINYGCTITSLMIPDRNGVLGDIVLGFDDLEGYLKSDQSMGCVVGRYANRIADGKFSMDGKEYQLDINLPPHHIHGGQKGLGKVVWDATIVEEENRVGIQFSHISPDGHEGYPGKLSVEVNYFLNDDNTLSFEYTATSDQNTIINLTQHSYFNLNGGSKNILEHELILDSDYFLPVDDMMIPTGELRSVTDTPFDFRKQKTVGRDIDQHDTQLAIGHGYDHCWVIQSPEKNIRLAATLFDSESGRTMEVFTTEPGIQLYTSNFLNSIVPGKKNIALTERLGICLETQHFPDSPNRPSFPSTTLTAGEIFRSMTLLRFLIQ